MINKVGLIGLGAVGAVVAQQLEKVLENKLYCIVDKERKLKYEQNGIYINNQKQHFNLVTPDEVPEVDLIIIATKNLQLTEALQAIQKAVGPNTKILSLLNGIHSETEISQTYGAEKTLYGFIINLESINLSGNISCTSNGNIVFGDKSNKKTNAVTEVEDLFFKAGICYKIPENIQFEMWKKFLINTVFNSLGAITRSTYGGFNFDVMKNLARKVGNEVIEVANAEGIPLTKEILEEDIKLTCSYNPLGKCSMLQDMEAQRLTENDFFCGTIHRLGEKHNIKTPHCDFLQELIMGTELVRTIKK